MDRFFVTVYSGRGYSGAIAIQQGLRAIGIESGITQGGGVSVGSLGAVRIFCLGSQSA